LVLLADMPEICTTDLEILLAAFQRDPDHILRATAADGAPGHPVVFPNWARAELLALEGDIGAKPVLKAHADAVRHVALPANHATTDLDSPEDWAAWRKTQ
jgi:CTP:molybdopterin cytidylyltransferase MocA